MRTIPARRSAGERDSTHGTKGLAVRHPFHPVCGLRTVAAPVPFLDAGRPVFLDQVMIGQNRALLLAEIAGNIYVLGVTDHNIIKLLEIDDPSQVALFTAEDLESKESPSALWKKCLERYLTNRGNRSGDYNKED